MHLNVCKINVVLFALIGISLCSVCDLRMNILSVLAFSFVILLFYMHNCTMNRLSCILSRLLYVYQGYFTSTVYNKQRLLR